MNDRQRERDAGEALTGATGDLVPPDPTDELLTGERRAIENPSGGGDLTPSERGPEEEHAGDQPAGEPGGRRSIPAPGTDVREEEPDRF